MRRDKHYAWLLRGHFKGLLEGAASSTTLRLEVKPRADRLVGGDRPFMVACHWAVCSPCYTYNAVCLRGNAKQRRQQRRAVERFLAEDQKKDLVDLGAPFPYQKAFVDSLDQPAFIEKNDHLRDKMVSFSTPIQGAAADRLLREQIDTHGGIVTVSPVREETDAEWSDRVDGGNLYRGPN